MQLCFNVWSLKSVAPKLDVVFPIMLERWQAMGAQDNAGAFSKAFLPGLDTVINTNAVSSVLLDTQCVSQFGSAVCVLIPFSFFLSSSSSPPPFLFEAL